MAKRVKNRNRMPEDVYRAVFDRAESDIHYAACEAMLPGVCSGVAESWHHRQLRSQGGPHHVSNGLAVCSKCHTWFHHNPTVSYTEGWLVKSHDDFTSRPVRRRGRLTLLLPGGGLELVPEADFGRL